MDAITFTFPRLKSAGLRGARAIGTAQMTGIEKTTNGQVVKKTLAKRGRGKKGKETRGAALSSK